MPEGDTVFAAAARLREALVGKTLTRCDIRVPQYATVDLTGETVEEVLSRGKHLFIRVGAASIHSHLKMDGSWLVGTVRVPSHKVRIILETDTSRASGVDLGVLEVLDRADDLDAVAHLGPDLLGADWSAELAANNLMTDPARPMAEALLDQRVMAGVGNVYANELCFVFGLRPLTPVGSLDNPLRVVTRHKKCCGPTGYGGIAPSPAIPDGVPNSGCTAGPASRAGAAARPFRPTKPVTGCATGVRRVKNEACSQLRTTAIFRPSAC